MKLRDLFTLNRTRIHAMPRPAFPTSGYGGAMDQRGVLIGRVLEGKGVACHLDMSAVILTPRLVSYPFRPHLPHLIEWRGLAAYQDTLEGVLGISPVRVSTENGIIWVETPREEGQVVTCWEYEPEGALGVPLGMDGRGRILNMRFGREDVPHLLLIGPTQAGKTTCAYNIAFQLVRSTLHDPDALRMLAVVSDPSGWEELLGVRQWWGVALHDEAPGVIGWLRREVKEREAERRQWPAVVAFLDDYPALLEDYPDVAADVDGIARQGRRAGVHLVINTQEATRAGAGRAPRLITDKLVFGQGSAADAALASGRGRTGAETLMGKGDMLLTTSRLQRPVRLTGLLATPDDLARLPSGGWESPPWLHQPARTSPEAPAISEISPISPISPISAYSEAARQPETHEIETPQEPVRGLIALIGLTEREQEIVRLVREQKSPHEIAKELTGQSGGPKYQECAREVKALVARLLA